MPAKIISAAVVGLDAYPVEVEADTGGGELGSFAIVGLPDAAVAEARERVRSAIKNSGFEFPRLKVTVNLAPANLPKHGSVFDLPIALSILAAADYFSKLDLSSCLFVGELALNGDLRPVNGILPISAMARDQKIKTLFVPPANAREAKLMPELEVIAARNFKEITDHLLKKTSIPPSPYEKTDFSQAAPETDMAFVRGQEHVKRAMEIAAAGAHNLLMFGPPGSGKTLLAKTFASILPDLTLEEALEITKIYSVSGKLKNEGLIKRRPFRSPHHTASDVALIGGGTRPLPGEITLSHRGVLFLDEFTEFQRNVLEALRQPLEDGVVTISRAAGSIEFPAKFILIASMNPCPCGYWGDRAKDCICSAGQILSYRKKISGPILDRIDMHLEVPRPEFQKLTDGRLGESSAEIKKRVEAARERQRARLRQYRLFTNSEMDSRLTREICQTSPEAEALLKEAVNRLSLSARSYFRLLKLARTIADLEGAQKISSTHLAEALQYREKES